MSLIGIGAEISIPSLRNYGGNNVAILDAADESLAFIIKIPKTGTLKKVCLQTSTVTTGDVVNVRIETVDASTGDPTGTLYDANGTGTVDVAATDDNKGLWVAINTTNGISVTKNNIVAIRFSLDFVDGNIQFARNCPGVNIVSSFPYADHYAGSAWTKYTGVNVGLEYDTGIIHVYGIGSAYVLSSAFNSGSAANQVGNRIRLPYGARAVGAWLSLGVSADLDVIFYDSDGITALETITIDKDVIKSSSDWVYVVPFATARTLTKDAYYRIVAKPSSATNLSIGIMDVFDDGANKGIDQLELGQNCHYTTCSGTPDEEADWTQTTTRRAMFGLIIDQIEVGGGLLTRRVMCPM